ncbi:hypothetical protein CYY_004687 [Polysphondylium violaceum]|uniref:Uncharacterized protein n=1 Tax=Polysphondylium violaceum TaxID=133409 RepID=A0A8J4UZ40_9MYCE|nr:hypothetical protein CYY_004687 [Polysphondylium violaceum]
MKSITNLSILLLISSFAFIMTTAYPITGYGYLSQSAVHTINEQTGQNYAEMLTPVPKNVIAFAGVSNSTPSSYDFIYSNSQGKITWGQVDYSNGDVSDLHTFVIPNIPQPSLATINGAQLVKSHDSNTVFFLTYGRGFANDILYWVTSSVDSQNEYSTKLWPIALGTDNAQGVFDYESNRYYYIVTITQYTNTYKCWMMDTTHNTTSKITSINTQVDQLFRIYTYNGNLYIVQPTSDAGIIINLVDWTGSVQQVAKFKVDSQPTDVQISLVGDYLGIFSITHSETEFVLVDLRTFNVYSNVEGTPTPYSNYFIF